MRTNSQDKSATWRVRTKFGQVRLIIDGEFHQEFSILMGSDVKWMARMLRKAMRRLAPEKESRAKGN